MRQFFITLMITLLLASSFLSAAPKSVEERLKVLEAHMQQTPANSGNADVASLVAKVDAMLRDHMELKGAIDANRFLMESAQKDLSRQYQDLDVRMRAQEERIKILLVQVEKVLAKTSPQVADENKLYQAALDKIEENSYLEAAASFTRFLERYPKSTFAPQASFWIAESYFETADYQRAIKEYQKVVDKYPKNEKAREALLRQGQSFQRLGLKDEAKLFLQKVQSDYPQTPEALQAAKLLEQVQQAVPAAQPNVPLSSYPNKTIQEEKAVPELPPSASVAPVENVEPETDKGL